MTDNPHPSNGSPPDPAHGQQSKWHGPPELLDPFPPQAICWPALSDDETAEHFVVLDDWVDWLTDRYALDHRTIPPCWAEHAALLEELSALRTGWLASYCLTASGEVPLTWHAAFAHARHRLADWAARTGCRPGEHRPN